MLLLLLLSLAFSIGTTMVYLVARMVKRRQRDQEHHRESELVWSLNPAHSPYLNRPACWLAIKSQNLVAVQAALRLNNPTPCGWTEGLEKKLFIAPPVKGWVLIVGSGLPDPSDDVDRCYRFVLRLSRKLGHVQLFSWNRVLNHHAWVRADGGRIVRAYAWAGRTIWKEGARTPTEIDLDLKCPGYGETYERTSFGQIDAMAANVEKLPLLAARWSLDPAEIDELHLDRESGIAGEPSRSY
jgi:hypothetical protein